MHFDRITHDPDVMGGKPCIRGMRVTAGMVVGLLASGHPRERILAAYPYLEAADLDAPQAARALVKALLKAGALPTKAADDAFHLAIAAANAIPYL